MSAFPFSVRVVHFFFGWCSPFMNFIVAKPESRPMARENRFIRYAGSKHGEIVLFHFSSEVFFTVPNLQQQLSAVTQNGKDLDDGAEMEGIRWGRKRE